MDTIFDAITHGRSHSLPDYVIDETSLCRALNGLNPLYFAFEKAKKTKDPNDFAIVFYLLGRGAPIREEDRKKRAFSKLFVEKTFTDQPSFKGVLQPFEALNIPAPYPEDITEDERETLVGDSLSKTIQLPVERVRLLSDGTGEGRQMAYQQLIKSLRFLERGEMDPSFDIGDGEGWEDIRKFLSKAWMEIPHPQHDVSFLVNQLAAEISGKRNLYQWTHFEDFFDILFLYLCSIKERKTVLTQRLEPLARLLPFFIPKRYNATLREATFSCF